VSTNAEVVAAFLDQRRESSRAMQTDGTTVFSYMEPIARWVAGRVRVGMSENGDRTRTQRRHRAMVIRMAQRAGKEVSP
jgi:hypothetical protein